MKPVYLVCLALITIGLLASNIASGQAQSNNSVEAEIIALEKRAFEAWRNKDRKFFEEVALAESLAIAPSGIYNKEEWVKANADPNCTVKSYSLDNIKVTMLSKDIALMTYRFTHDTVCNRCSGKV